jgi:hypothetical protein
MFLYFGILEAEIIQLLMEVLLRVEVEIVVFLALIEELLLHTVLPPREVLLDLELLTTQFVHQLDIALEKVLRHGCYIFIRTI